MPKLFERLRGGLQAEQADCVGQTLAMSGPAEIVAAKEGDEDKLATFDAIAYTGEVMKVQGWRYPLIIDLTGIKAELQQLPALKGHDDDRVVGHTTDLSATSEGVRVQGIVSGVGADAKEVVSSSKNGFPWQVSLGSDPVPGAVEHLKAGKKATVNGREVKGPLSIVRSAVVSEMSFVARGADNKTSAVIAAQYESSNTMFKEWIEAQGFELDTLSDKQRTSLEAAFKLQESGDVNGGEGGSVKAAKPTEDLKTIVTAAVKEATEAATEEINAQRTLRDSVQAACEGHPEIAAKAASENWSVDKAELEVIRANRPKPIFAPTGKDGAPEGAQVIEAALCVNAGMDSKLLEKNFDEKTINAAMGGNLRGFGFHALMYETIRAAGRSISPGMANDSLIRTAFEADKEIRASAVSNYSLGGMLANVSNKFIVGGFNSVESVWRKIAKIGTVKDFKQTNGYRLTGDFTYEEIGSSGELKHAEMGEETYTNQAKTFGKIFGISRTTLINDDLNAIETTARLRIGRGAGLKINNVFWTEFLSNSSFFTAARSNYAAGAGTALDIDSLTQAEALFMDAEDENGDPTNLDPVLLLVPTGLFVPADVLMRSTEVRDTTASKKAGVANPHAGKFEVVTSRYLNKTAYSGSSALAWYLLCDANDAGVGVIEIVFLNGKQEPTVETTTLDFDQLGIQMRGYHDFGAAKQEYHCGVKMKGEA